MKNYRIVRVLTHYLEMVTPPSHPFLEEKEDCQVVRMKDPNIFFYRYLYKQVGEDITWVNRLVIPDDDLYSIISAPEIEIYVLYYKGCPAGYAEIDMKNPKEIELVYFGLEPRYRGKGLGKYLLGWIANRVWTHSPERFWLHTCELDHEAALSTYQKGGFKVYDSNMVDQIILD